MNNYIAITILCVVLSQDSSWAAPPSKEIATGPDNTVVVLTQASSVLLQCCVTNDTISIARPQWWEYATKTGGNQISDGDMTLTYHPNYRRYRLIVSPNRQCYNLNITGLTTADGTKYMCLDFNANLPSVIQLGAQLIVIAANPTCNTLIVSGFDALEGAYYTIECSVDFGSQPPIAPVMSWTGPPPFNVLNITTNTSLHSSLGFFASRTMDGQTFTVIANISSTSFGGDGMATNMPTWTYNWTSAPLHVTWPPRPSNVIITPADPAVDQGINLTCSCDANPPAAFFWQAVTGPVAGRRWEGPDLEVTMDMTGLNTLRCNARNVINGRNNTADAFFNVTVNPIDACISEPCQFGSECVRNVNDYICNCVPGVTGRNCESLINYCDSQPCQNGATCLHTLNVYSCVCRSKYTGTHCETHVDDLDSTVLPFEE